MLREKKEEETPRAVTPDRHAVTSRGASASQPFFYSTRGHMRKFLVSVREGGLFCSTIVSSALIAAPMVLYERRRYRRIKGREEAKKFATVYIPNLNV